MSPDSTTRRWVGAAIAGIALGLGVFALLGILISERYTVPRLADVVVVHIAERISPIEHGRYTMRVRGQVVASDDQSMGIPHARFCKLYPNVPWKEECLDPESTSGSEGAFDFLIQSPNEQQELMVTAPGCSPQKLLVRRHHPRYQVMLDCPQKPAPRCPNCIATADSIRR